MANHIWNDALADGDIGAAGNWTGGVPVNAGDAYINTSSRDITGSMDQSAVNPASWTVGPNFKGTIGTAGSPLKLGTVTMLRYHGVNCKSCNLWPADMTEGYVTGTHPAPLSLYFVNGTLTLMGVLSAAPGALRIGASVTSVNAYYGNHSGLPCFATIDSGATLSTTQWLLNGTVTCNADATTINVLGGIWDSPGDSEGDVTTLNIQGGTFRFSSNGDTIATANVYSGLLDGSLNDRIKTITNLNVYARGTANLINGSNSIALTNTPTNYGGVIRWLGTITNKAQSPLGTA